MMNVVKIIKDYGVIRTFTRISRIQKSCSQQRCQKIMFRSLIQSLGTLKTIEVSLNLRTKKIAGDLSENFKGTKLRGHDSQDQVLESQSIEVDSVKD